MSKLFRLIIPLLFLATVIMGQAGADRKGTGGISKEGRWIMFTSLYKLRCDEGSCLDFI